MKIKYEFITGEIIEIETEVSKEIEEAITTFERKEANARRKARRNKEASLEAMKEETGWEIVDKCLDIEAEYEKCEEMEAVASTVGELWERQQALIHSIYFEERTTNEIAIEQGIDSSAIRHQLKTIHNKLKKLLEKSSRFDT